MTQSYRPGAAIVELLNGENKGQQTPVGLEGREVVWIGSECGAGDPCIRIEAPGVSRKHAMIEWREGKLWLMDAGSEAGTRVNGMKVTSTVPLAVGDRIAFAEIVARVRERE